MAHLFETTDAKHNGYDIEQVDQFIAKARAQFADFSQESLPAGHLRQVEFDLVKGGYATDKVDEAIARLEDAFAEREIKRDKAQLGDYAIDDRHARLKTLILGRAERPANNKFDHVPIILRGYSRKQVDALVVHIERHLLSGAPLTINDVRSAIFKAKRGGYVEGQVDAFLDRVIEILQIEKNR